MEIIITYYILHCGLYELQVFCYYYVYQWLRHYTCSGFCKTSYHLLISPPPTNLPNTLKIHNGENKIDHQGSQYTCQFPVNCSMNPDVFCLKLFASQGKGDHPSKFQHAGVHRFGGVREQTNKQTHSLIDWRFYRVTSGFATTHVVVFLYVLLQPEVHQTKQYGNMKNLSPSPPLLTPYFLVPSLPIVI